ncbi:MAG: 16S rRNA (cytidine(1402)-2'-O)-methyltransferase [Gammaproteobacteria bacterium]|nr:16S rRNA (cytidine(1402)-2'-O)-methyltransferase [Gammaproteobacteria bacterium]
MSFNLEQVFSQAEFHVSTKPGKLFVVATPIGNLDDISVRAGRVLALVAVIAAEDTRRSGLLLQHLGINTPLAALHDHNERAVAPALLQRLLDGEDIALISDAGTPLLSDPGYRLVSGAHENGIEVVPVPGPSAITAALSVCGLPVHRFAFEGYLPERVAARRALLQQLARESRTLIFFETPHRIDAALQDLIMAFGSGRRATIARELTKRFETVRRDELGALARWFGADPVQHRGEFVIVVEGAGTDPGGDDAELARMLGILLAHLSVKDTAAVAAEFTGRNRNELYKLALKLKPREQ